MENRLEDGYSMTF